MVSTEFDAEAFERKLQSLKDSQESIQSLSAWCLERRTHHKKIVATWLQVLKKVKVEHRLTLFYLANDVIQYSKRKNFEFVESWGTALQRATTMVRDEKVKHRILRIFKIWDQRGVYDEEFLADLSGLISAAPKKKVEPQPVQPEEFQAPLLISTMRSCATLEQATDARLRDLRDTNTDFNNLEELRSSLKDRRRVEDAEKEVDIATKSIENYIKALEAEIGERKQVLDLLDQADQFYETQRGEVKIVVNAYRNFGGRVKNLKKKLDELIPMLASPLPSPDINAPSPSPDSDIELPEENPMNQSSLINVAPPTMYGSFSQDYNPLTALSNNSSGDFSNNFSSFIGGNIDFDARNVFNDSSNISNNSNQYDSVDKIDARNSLVQDNSNEPVSNYLKTVLPASDEAPAIPGLGLDVGDMMSDKRPIQNDYRPPPVVGMAPTVDRMMNVPNAPKGNLNQIHMSHSTPLQNRIINGESHTPSPYSSESSQNNTSIPLNAFDSAPNPINPLLPPPMPPIEFLDDNTCYNKLPPKFPTWTFANEAPKEKVVFPVHNDTNPIWPVQDGKLKPSWNESSNDQWSLNNSESAWNESMDEKNMMLSETPESPPMYEKTSFNTPLEYNDSQTQEPLLSSIGDVDHRVLPVSMKAEKDMPYRLIKNVDVDHRNLISLTGSPANNSNDAPSGSSNNLWSNMDQDYRRPSMQAPGDNVESVDMEMSDEEAESKKANRVLVDLRSQDRDMRISNLPPVPPPSGMSRSNVKDMDMRTAPTGGSRMGNISTDLRGVDTRPPPPPPLPQFQQGQSNFHQEQQDFRSNKPMDFRPNHSFHQNTPDFKPNFSPNQPQDFHQHPQSKEFFDNQMGRGGGPMPRGRGRGNPVFRGSGAPGGSPRPPWMDRGGHQRQMPMGNFQPTSPGSNLGPRGMKPHRGSPFRGGNMYRGRGRGGQNW
ncbi:hypothetical protein TKK_0004507 [Trichogramma kaykai]|uniref:Regulation of nuclear pre-mRNA domain-containing protein 2 n=1 Tax=Trichogramma kaykai TaxID=54128 RepID=A0ABD2XLL7_9HYME